LKFHWKIYLRARPIHPHQISLLYVGVGLMWSYDRKRYAGGSVATGRISSAGQVKGDDQDKKRYPGFSGWGFGVGLTTPTHKKP
jgi:hypothetical protein